MNYFRPFLSLHLTVVAKMALHSSLSIILLKLLFLASYVYAARDLGFTDDTDLYSFVSVCQI